VTNRCTKSIDLKQLAIGHWIRTDLRGYVEQGRGKVVQPGEVQAFIVIGKFIEE